MVAVECAHDSLVDTATLVPNPRNPNRHPAKQIELLAKIIKNTGWRNPIVVSNRSGFIVKGHARLEAAKLMGEDKVPVDYQDYSNEAMEWADMVADNRIAELAEPDLPELKDLLQELDTGAFDMDLTGFDNKALEELMTQTFQPKTGLTHDDAIPEPKETLCKAGDLWLLGAHRLLCGDSTKPEDVARLMNGEKADMVFTDPPYGVNYEGGASNQKKRERLAGDSGDIYSSFVSLLPVKEGTAMYVWFASTLGKPVFESLREWQIRAMIVWVKLNPHYGAFTAHYKQRHEAMLYCVRGTPVWNGPTNDTTVWEYPQASRNELHPTQKPVALCEHGISNSSNDDGIVFDGFLGSGTTLIACEKLNRKCYGMEIDPHYCDVIIKRWEDYTGKKAELFGKQ